jgi:hypothetical protein
MFLPFPFFTSHQPFFYWQFSNPLTSNLAQDSELLPFAETVTTNEIKVVLHIAVQTGELLDMECRRARFWVPLFLLYINDLPSALSTDNKSLLYADDASILVSGTNIDEIQERSKLMLNSLSQWFKCNGLTLNSRKTKVLKF